MVLLGTLTPSRGEPIFVLLNTWIEMPLIFCTSEYLAACDAQIQFLNGKQIPNANDLTFLKNAFCCETASPPDHLYCDDDEGDFCRLMDLLGISANDGMPEAEEPEADVSDILSYFVPITNPYYFE